MKTETKASEKWTASEYLDDGRWGILNEQNEIVVRISAGLTKELASKIVRAVNSHDALVEALGCVDEDDGWEYLHPGTRMAVKSALALAKEGKC